MIAADTQQDDWSEACSPYADHDWMAAIPTALAPWLLPISWNRERLWALTHRPTMLPITELRWLYELPLWSAADGSWFQITPADYMRDPAAYPAHDQRVRNADLAHPLHAVQRRGRWFLLDGVHRLVRADVDDLECVTAVVVTAEDLPKFATPRARAGDM